MAKALMAALGFGVLSAAALSPSLSHAQAFDDRPGTFAPLLGFIGVGGDEPTERGDIDFRERAPIVVPKTRDLPPPRPGTGPRVANWPQDQEIVRRRQEAAGARAPQQIEVNRNPLLSQADLQKGRSNDTPVAVNMCDTYTNGVPDCAPTAMDKIKRVFTLGDSNKDTVVVGKEPDRGYLTEPPKGYRRATQTTTATRETSYERPDAANPGAYYREQAQRGQEYQYR